MGADNAAADHQHLGRQHPRNPAQQHAAPAVGLLQRPRPDLRRQPPRNFRHRCQQRQATPVVRHRLISNRRDAAGQQIGRLLGIGCQMQIGEQHLPLTQPCPLDRLRFLDLHDHLGPGENRLSRRQHRGPCRNIIGIRKARTHTGPGLDRDGMATVHRLTRGIGCHADAEFLRLDLFRATDLHVSLPLDIAC